FYNGLLSPVSLHDLNYFIRQGYPRELLFWLFADTIELTVGGTIVGFQYNPPDDYGFPPREPRRRCLREFVEIATITGLSVEAKTVRPSEGGGKSGSGGKSSDSGAVTDGAAAAKDEGGKGSGSGKSSSGGGERREYSRFCFDPVLAERGKRAMDPARLAIL